MANKPRLPPDYEFPESVGDWTHDPEDRTNGHTWISPDDETAVRVFSATGVRVNVSDERVSGFGAGETVHRHDPAPDEEAGPFTDERREIVADTIDEAAEWMREQDPAEWSDPAVCEAVFDAPPGYVLDGYTIEDRYSEVYYLREGADEASRVAGAGIPEEYTAESCPYLYIHIWNGSGNATVALAPFRGAHGPGSKHQEIEPVAEPPEECGIAVAIEHAREWAAENAGTEDQPSVCTVISCGKAKSLDEGDDETVPARELYSSGTHTCKDRFAENSDAYYIMSAKHGLLEPDQEIGYYDRSLDELSDLQRRRLAADVAADLLEVLEAGGFDGLVLLGRADYVAALEPHFWALPADILTPFQTCDDVTGSGTAMRWCNNESHWPNNVESLPEIATVREAEPPTCRTMDCDSEAAASFEDLNGRLVHYCEGCYDEPCGLCGDHYEEDKWRTGGMCRDCQDEIESWSEDGSEEPADSSDGEPTDGASQQTDLSGWSA